MLNYNIKQVNIALILCYLLTIGPLTNAQAVEPTLSVFLNKLKTISPTQENLHYDSFPGFDFSKFRPLQKSYTSQNISFIIGTSPDKKIRSVVIKVNSEVIGTMNVSYFGSFKILTFTKVESIMGEYPDFPIVCVSDKSSFIIYLNKHFQYQRSYTIDDIATIRILRDDFFPVCDLTIRNRYIHMLSSIDYINGGSRVIDKITAYVVFEPENDEELLIGEQSRFTEEYYVPKADFITFLHPKIKQNDLPYWIYAKDWDFE